MSVSLPSDDEMAAAAVAVATELLAEATRSRTRREARRMARVGRMVLDPHGTAFTLALTDEVLRIHQPRRAARRLRDLVGDFGAPRFLGPVDRLALRAGGRVGQLLPGIVMPMVTARLRREGGSVIIAAEPRPLTRHIARRRAEGIRLNLNVLGEAILGEEEAARRVESVLVLLGRPDVDYVSVKISSVYSQVSALAFDHTVAEVAARVRRLLVAAAESSPPKFVNLDMEEYRDLHLTAAVFRSVLDDPLLIGLDAGIVLQAYLPDSLDVLDELATWSAGRKASGGGEIKVRIVKGANLAMERVDAELHGWNQAPFTNKADVDANFKRMLDLAIDRGVRIGVGSHNLFEVAWALVQRRAHNVAGLVELEMLEGMAESQARAARNAAGTLLLYAPVAARRDVESSIAYLTRRLDENTGPDNFLRHVFSLRPGSAEFFAERDRFLAAVVSRHRPASGPRREQNRSLPTRPVATDDEFVNEPDTDFSLATNRAWINDVLSAALPTQVPAVVSGVELLGPQWELGTDPSHPADSLYRYTVADLEVVERAVSTAVGGGRRWATTPPAQRRATLANVATIMADGRGDAIAAMVRDAAKTVTEADTEVSEAIDFARYYPTTARLVESFTEVEAVPLGPIVVAPPWNFPYSIPAGGVMAALAAGNAVILKPAPETVLTAWVLARQCWEGGVPGDVLQFLPCRDDDVGRRLVTHPDVAAVILTGSWDTARLFQSWRPAIRLHAETSGKDAIVVTAAADIDAAVRDLIHSAFWSAGQKCSAASLAIVESAVLDDPAFLRRLGDATRSLRVGPSDDLATSVGPLIRPPTGPLARALTTLDAGESWLVEPRMIDGNPHLWSPGVKLGVQPGSWFHRTECFGPVLGVMRAADLDDAIRLQNDTAFGLTGGIHSLDRRELDRWLETVEVGNAYVNRQITGAIVRRQPFGGWKRSSVGPGAKAGGPNQVLTLTRFAPSAPLEADLATAATSFAHWHHVEFSKVHDPTGLASEANLLRYVPLPNAVLLRAGPGATETAVATALLAARTARVAVTVSSVTPLTGLEATTQVTVEDERSLIARLETLGPALAKLRLLGQGGDDLLTAAANVGLEVDDTAVVPNGRLELLRWYREQAISVTLHRYGNIVDLDGGPVPSIAAAARRARIESIR